jgi:hypothetical protein
MKQSQCVNLFSDAKNRTENMTLTIHVEVTHRGQALCGVLYTHTGAVLLPADGRTEHGRVRAGVDVIGNHATSFRPVVGGTEKNRQKI